jgi:hypothetical protein
MTKPVTLPPASWDAAEPVKIEERMIAPPAPPYLCRLIKDTFNGKVDGRDIQYMAKALLQMSDEIFELRARMDGIEMAVMDGSKE